MTPTDFLLAFVCIILLARLGQIEGHLRAIRTRLEQRFPTDPELNDKYGLW